MDLLNVKDLTMRFGGLKAVDGLSFTARRGDITAVIGPNGAGKTTVFNCITGFYRPTAGALALTHADGRQFALEKLPGHRIAARAKVARTFQNIRLWEPPASACWPYSASAAIAPPRRPAWTRPVSGWTRSA